MPTVIATDQRRLQFERAPYASRAIRTGRRGYRNQQARMARNFATVERTRHYVTRGAMSLVDYGRKLGFDESETRTLARAGRAMRAAPLLSGVFISGYIGLDALAAMARLTDDPEFARDWRRWVELARTNNLKEFRRRVTERVEQLRGGLEAIHAVTMFVKESTREAFARARQVASRKLHRLLTDGETLDTVTDHYLDCFDPLRQPEGQRRLGPTDELPKSRYIPVSVQRKIRRRAGDVCEFPDCSNFMNLAFAHKHPHRDGSGREADDLWLACPGHHTSFDAGWFKIIEDSTTTKGQAQDGNLANSTNDRDRSGQQGRPVDAPGGGPTGEGPEDQPGLVFEDGNGVVYRPPKRHFPTLISLHGGVATSVSLPPCDVGLYVSLGGLEPDTDDGCPDPSEVRDEYDHWLEESQGAAGRAGETAAAPARDPPPES